MTEPERPPSRERDIAPDGWPALEPLVDELLDAPPADRPALYTRLSGGDPRRHAALERLVSECERPYPLLDRPVVERFPTLFDDRSTRFPDALADRYRVTRELARGGMATVFLARDVKHAREVAVKVMHPELVASLGSDRFLREITIAANLRHPHIVPLFDSGEANGLLYYVMPYQDGLSLRARIERDGPLPVADAVLILREVCDALAYAHAQGFVHRDIKPDNILLSGRHALVADFGVARAITAATEDPTLTAAGSVVGTVAYMAPEQGMPRVPVDHRADIYAVGVVAYEMLAGQRPFTGVTPPNERPTHESQVSVDLARLRPDVPAALVHVVRTCLAADPAARYQRVEPLLDDLERVVTMQRDGTAREATTSADRSLGAGVAGATSGAVARPSRRALWIAGIVGVGVAATALALLTFVNAGRPPVAEAPHQVAVLTFDEGTHASLQPTALELTERMIGALGNVPGLQVPSLAAVQPYRLRRPPPDSLGLLLGARWLLSGRVFTRDDQFFVTAELSDAAARGRQLERWIDSAAVGDGGALMRTFVLDVATKIRERLGDDARLRRWRVESVSAEARAAMDRARSDVQEANVLVAANDTAGAWARFARADSALVQAARADARWAEPLVERASLERNIASARFGIGGDSSSVVRALGNAVAHAQAALRVAPNDARAREVYGYLLYDRSELKPPRDSVAAFVAAAESELRRATDTDTTLAGALAVLAQIHAGRGEYRQAQLLAERAYRVDAYYARPEQALSNLFTYSFENGEDAQARRWCDAFADALPDHWYAGYCRLTLMVWDQSRPARADSAWAVALHAAARAPAPIRPQVDAQLRSLVAGVLASVGLADSARRVLSAARGDAPVEAELLQIEASVRVLLGERHTADSLMALYFQQRPDDRAQLRGSRRFQAMRR